MTTPIKIWNREISEGQKEFSVWIELDRNKLKYGESPYVDSCGEYCYEELQNVSATNEEEALKKIELMLTHGCDTGSTLQENVESGEIDENWECPVTRLVIIEKTIDKITEIDIDALVAPYSEQAKQRTQQEEENAERTEFERLKTKFEPIKE